ncbi:MULTISPECIES: fumarylacetoacetate hydrolase family protein [unclassified Microbacterium]|uniref:fumarylacetoacetate hydrolase family protein n=1 Tax=unclassified Microbacterium TaxID=2609290 RepID=UPI00214D097A|nr:MULTISPECIES: fumarylacetoacetate hydrolase family protein [unclassified Microbacterium]MCR2810927.1 fumarylacetoacetate hydrolase family protein [Microbacterium sp. zg.B185]WIM19673.1 fumarylacetoacetate hydrolase family protein [Microbacterium sp. zg-B185]
MKIARWTHGETLGEGFVIEDQVVAFPDGQTVADVLRGGLRRAHDLYAAGDLSAGRPLRDVALLPPLVPASVRDFAVFEEHVEGMSADADGLSHVPEQWYRAPTFYFTNPHAIYGTEAVIRPPATVRLDYELEVAAVLGGDPGEDLDPVAAQERIFGYVIMNDWSARDLQSQEMNVRLGPAKGKDFATSLGPWIVTADEVADRVDADGFLALRAEVYVNGRLLGADLLSNMAWTFAELVSYSSRASRVLSGDVLGSGTVGNGGCLGELWGLAGGALTPPPLAEGDVVTMRVERLGELNGTVGPARAHPHLLPTARARPKPRARTFAGPSA